MVIDTYNPGTALLAQAERLWIQGQHELHNEILSLEEQKPHIITSTVS